MRIVLSRPTTVALLIAATGAKQTGHTLSPDTQITAVTTDSRQVQQGDLFIALKGESFDANDFLADVFAKGALAALATGPLPDHCEGATLLKVMDATRALGCFAKAYAMTIPHKTVAITGSVGKTTTKEFVSSVLAARYRVHKTEGNLNNQIGLPLTLLSMPADTECLVLEMGMSARGEIEYLSRLATPDMALITTVGSSHLEHLGTRENIARVKMEIAQGLKPEGKLLLQGDEPLLRHHMTRAAQVLYLSTSASADTDAIGVDTTGIDALADQIEDSACGCSFCAHIGSSTLPHCRIAQSGRHAVAAALFALTVGHMLGLSEDQLRQGLLNCRLGELRQRVLPLGDFTLIDDCYNAAPESVRAALSVLDLHRKTQGGRAVALLGDMKELGKHSSDLHLDVGMTAAKGGLDLLLAYGPQAQFIAQGAKAGGMDEACICCMREPDPQAAAQWLHACLRQGDALLVKASRAMHAEHVIAALSRLVSQPDKNEDQLRQK